MEQKPEFNIAIKQGEKKELRDRVKNDDFYINDYVESENGGLRRATLEEIEQQKISQREQAKQRIALISKQFEGFIKEHGGLTGAKKALVMSREGLLREEELKQPLWFTTFSVTDFIPNINLDGLQTKNKPDPNASDFRLPDQYPSFKDRERFFYDQASKKFNKPGFISADTPFALDTYYGGLIMKKVKEIFKGKIVVDLAVGRKPWDYLIADYSEARAYIGVEPFNTRGLLDQLNSMFKEGKTGADQQGRGDHTDLNGTPVALVKEDMLSFLKRLPDNSVSIWCSGIDRNIIPEPAKTPRFIWVFLYDHIASSKQAKN